MNDIGTRALAALLLFASPALADSNATGPESGDADSVTTKGTSEVVTIIKKKGHDCGTNITQGCKIGQTCFATIDISGESAQALYTMLKTHGTLSNEVQGDYVASKSGAIECTETDGNFYCTIGYDALKNTLTMPRYCDPE